MRIVSPAFQHQAKIPSKYTCDGENVNPPLSISDIPANAKSMVLIIDDPDAVSEIWDHWLVFNIPADTQEIKENSVPAGAVEGVTSFGNSGYGGPCPPPPSGTHRYFFKLYALDTTLNFNSSATKEEIEKAMECHVLEFTELIGLYSRG